MIILILIVLLFLMKKNYDKTPTEVWLLNGVNNDMYSQNVILAISSDYKKQFITGGSLYITNDNIINNSKEIIVEICYESDNSCVFNKSLNSTQIGVLKNNNPLTIGSRNTTSFKNGFIKKIDGSLFKTRNEFEEKLFSMYLKVTAKYENDSTETFTLKINPIHKFNKRIEFYEIPYIEENK